MPSPTPLQPHLLPLLLRLRRLRTLLLQLRNRALIRLQLAPIGLENALALAGERLLPLRLAFLLLFQLRLLFAFDFLLAGF